MLTNTRRILSIEEERKRNLEDILHHTKWEAGMVKKLGRKWFEMRDKWLNEAFERDKEMWRDPRVREALIKAILAEDEVKRKERKS